MALKVQDQSPEVAAMSVNWPVIAALMGGTKTMRDAGKTYLPQQPREDKEDYDYRLATATLFPAFRRTVGVMAGKPFSKEVTIGEDVPPRIDELLANIDGEGRSLHAFLSDVMVECMAPGYAGVLVDYTKVGNQARTLADEKALGARPYWVHIKHQQILGWKTERNGDKVRLVQLRIAETKEVEDGAFGVKNEPRVRVLEPGIWRVYMPGARPDDEWIIEDEGTTTIDVIPFVPYYGIRAAYMVGLPPLLDLAWQNVKHWQTQSDQDDSARFARKRLLVFIGIDQGGAVGEKGEVTASSAHALNLPVDGDAKVLQGSAESVNVGRKELEALEAQMIQTGAELLVAQPGQRTATEAGIDAEANKSELQRIVENFEDSVDQCLQLTAKWLSLEEGGHATLFKDYAASSLSEATAQLLLSLQQGGIITKETVIREQQRRGILSADIDPKDELAEVEAEGPPLGSLNDPNIDPVTGLPKKPDPAAA